LVDGLFKGNCDANIPIGRDNGCYGPDAIDQRKGRVGPGGPIKATGLAG